MLNVGRRGTLDPLPTPSGTVSSRPPAASVQQGSFFWATDVFGGALYQQVGGSWVRVGPTKPLVVNAETAYTVAGTGEVLGFNVCSIPANTIEASSVIEFVITGEIVIANNASARSPRIRLRYSTLASETAGVLLLDTTAMAATVPGSPTTYPWRLAGTVNVRTIGAAGATVPFGIEDSKFPSGAANASVPMGGATATVAIDTTAAKVLAVCIQVGTDADDIFRLEGGYVRMA